MIRVSNPSLGPGVITALGNAANSNGGLAVYGTGMPFAYACFDSNGRLVPSLYPCRASEAITFFSRLATQPSPARQAAYNALIQGLINTGVWSKLDALYVFAATDTSAANTNLISANYGLTASGSPAFAIDAGYTGTTGAKLDTGFDPTVAVSPNFVQNSGSLFAWRNTNPSPDTTVLIGADYSNLLNVDSGPQFLQALVNSTVGTEGTWSTAMQVPPQVIVGSRTGPTADAIYVNGITMGTGTDASSPPIGGDHFLILNDKEGDGPASPAQVSFAGFGAGLSNQDSRNLFNVMTNYMAAIAGGSQPVAMLESFDILNDGNINLTPGIARLADGRLFVAYSTPITSGVLKYVVSTDWTGSSWIAPVTLATPVSGSRYAEETVSVLPNGTILVVSTLVPNSAPYNTQIYVFQGTVADDLSLNFTRYAVDTSVNAVCDSAPHLLANGQVMLSFYGYIASSAQDNNTNYAIFSSDGGHTWGNQVTIGSGSDPNDEWDESDDIQLPNGNILHVLRNNNYVTTSRTGYWAVQSTNANGTAWGEPYQIISNDNPSRPSLAIMPDGDLFMLGRFDNGTLHQDAGYSYSTDNGLTWAPFADIYGLGSSTLGANAYHQAFYDAITQSVLSVISFGGFVGGNRLVMQQFAVK